MASERVIEDPILLAAPEIRGNEWQYIKECLDTGWVSSAGSFVDRFEQAIAKQVGVEYAVATVNGTAALHIALLVAGVQPGDEVLVSSLTFISPANAIRYVGAWPVFVDAEGGFWQFDVQQMIDFLEKSCQWQKGKLHNRTTGRPVSAVLPVHILGHPVDMSPVVEVARKFGLVVIEDATEGLGAQYRGCPVGSLGDIGCFSFNGNKIVTCGGGGMVVTDREEWAARARYLTTQAKDDPIEYVHNEVGYNYRLTNLQAAVGCAQAERLDDFVAAKRRIAETYAAALANIPGITLMQQADWAFSTYWLYTVLVDENEYGLGSRALLRYLGQKGIQSRPLWQPLHLSPAHTETHTTGCQTAEWLYRKGLSLPCSVGLTQEDQERVVSVIVKMVTRR